MSNLKRPAAGAIAEAANNPGGWVYEIGEGLDPNGAIPPQAIIGAWQVGPDGKIVGEFKPNPNYDAQVYPASDTA